MSLARDILDRIFFPDRDVHAIPVLDGGFSPNQRLEEAESVAEFEEPDAIARAVDGALYVSSGDTVFVANDDSRPRWSPFAKLRQPVGAVACSKDRIYVAALGHGVIAFDRNGREVAELTEANGAVLRCVTALAVSQYGSVYATDGSRHNGPEDWLQDLMWNRQGSERLIACDADLRQEMVLKDGMSWPAGIALSGDEQEVLVTEAWAHRLSAVAKKDGAVRVIVRNFAGYPARIVPASEGGYWIAFFALRTQLTEFLLREHRFRERMMREIPKELWIGPSLGGHFDYREPNQIGRIKKLGIQKSWAPARSYGLVARVSDAGYAAESLHSRAAGSVHGVTDVVESGDRLFVVSKGRGKVLVTPLKRRAA